MEFNKTTFVAPSGHSYTIREQNGQDEEILTNLRDVENFTHFTNFIMAIIVDSSRNPGHKLTYEQVDALPVLDRYAILFQARIFSIGALMEFEYTWPDGPTCSYEENLDIFLLPYDKLPSMPEEEFTTLLVNKPHAIPMYPCPGKEKDIEITLSSNRKVKFDLLDGSSERYLAKLKDHETTRNSELLARNLRLEVDGKWEKVYNFSLFSLKDMRELRGYIHKVDPTFNPVSEVEHPQTGKKTMVPILASPSFFFPGDLEMMP